MIPKAADEPLASLTVRRFVEVLGSRTPAPGGGSASALVAAMGAALGAMVGWMTYGKRKFEDKDPVMRRLIPPLHAGHEGAPPDDRPRHAGVQRLPGRGGPAEGHGGGEGRRARGHAGRPGEGGAGAARGRCASGTAAGTRCWRWPRTATSPRAPTSRSGRRRWRPGSGAPGATWPSTCQQIEDEAFRDAVSGESGALAERAAAKCHEVLAALAVRKG